MSPDDVSLDDVSLDDEALFRSERPRLIGLSYRLLGSLADAEDVVQEAWVRWNRADRSGVDSPAAWLTTVVSRLGIDRLRVRQHEQKDYVGPWLPEPLVSFEDQPAEAAELSDSLTTAFLVLLERLSPDERLVLLLADVFQQPFSAVADVIAKSEVATRQIAVRARRKVRTDSETHRPAASEQLAVAQRFVLAIVQGDEAQVRNLLAHDAVLVSDGGPHHRAARRPVMGPYRIARLLLNLSKRTLALEGVDVGFAPVWVNGSPGLVVTIDREPYWVAEMEIRDGVVERFYSIVNPLKLTMIEQSVDLV